ncbi:MAG: RNase adapter RapZ [Myxococcales bacterium]|nr:RNase adapter RapZ [Myxococcales bacterium]
MNSTELKTVIVTGLSGSGKTTVVHALEDIGFFCIDNLPIVLLQNVVELVRKSSMNMSGIAVGMDVRSREFLVQYPRVFSELEHEGVDLEIVFLDATDLSLQRRYTSTRRPHPLDRGDLIEGIRRERQILRPLRERAHLVVDTSEFNIHQLTSMLQEKYAANRDIQHNLSLTFRSFAYPEGIPLDADLVLDVRFLPNPYYVEELRPLTGRDAKVRQFLYDQPITRDFLERLGDFLGYLLPQYEREGKRYLTVAVGCTGGRHRSVTVVEWLRERFADAPYSISVEHRDVPASEPGGEKL